MYILERTRDQIEDQRRIRQLAGVEEYNESELRYTAPLLEMEDSQLQNLLEHSQWRQKGGCGNLSQDGQRAARKVQPL